MISPTHKRAAGLAPVWGSEFTIKVANYRGGSVKIAAGLKRHFWDLAAWLVPDYQPPPLWNS
jgi:hypothetical protein